MDDEGKRFSLLGLMGIKEKKSCETKKIPSLMEREV